MSRRIAVVTVGRSDYGLYQPLLRALWRDPGCKLCLIVSGAHLAPAYGNTDSEIEEDGFPIVARVPMLLAGDHPEDVSISVGVGVINFTSAYRQICPDILVVLGDRFEMLAAVVAALPLRIPVAHLYGGELTFGAMDDAIRHAITKLSHLHFTSTELYARRLRQMGEEPDRIFVTGATVIDTILHTAPIPQAELEAELGAKLDSALLVTFHPVTLRHEDNASGQAAILLEALSRFECELIFTYPNADAGNRGIISQIAAFAARHPRAHVYANLGHRRYLSLQRYVAVMVGNSSSGIIEAASFCLPVVNVGERQAGRIRTPNVIDVPVQIDSIVEAIGRALDPEFRKSLAGMRNPYGEGDASQKIVELLKTFPLDHTTLVKRFRDVDN